MGRLHLLACLAWLLAGCGQPSQPPPESAPANVAVKKGDWLEFKSADGSIQCKFPADSVEVNNIAEKDSLKISYVVRQSDETAEAYSAGWVWTDEKHADLAAFLKGDSMEEYKLVGEPSKVSLNGLTGVECRFDENGSGGQVLMTARAFQKGHRVYMFVATGWENRPEFKARSKEYFESFRLAEPAPE